MPKRKASLDWDSDIYSKGRQLNKWPFTDVVSQFHRFRAGWIGQKTPKVLEIGCGTGNNLSAIAGLGFEVWGIDQSPTAIEFGIREFQDSNRPLNLSVGKIQKLEFEDGYFDFVLDRGSITQVAKDEVGVVVSEVYRVLAKGGVFASHTLFGENHPEKSLGKESEDGSYDDFTGGYFRTVGKTSFFSYADLRRVLHEFTRVSIGRRTEELNENLVSEQYFFEAHKD